MRYPEIIEQEATDMIHAFSLRDKFDKFSEAWRPKIIGEVNDMHVKVSKLRGEFIWHRHENEDELFYLVKGRMEIRLKDQDAVVLREGDMTIIPRGVDHKPFAADEAWVMVIERETTVNTGNRTDSDRTVPAPEWI